MKKKVGCIIKLALLALSSITLVSCSVIGEYDANIRTSKMMEAYGYGIIHQPMCAEYEVGMSKISGTATVTFTSAQIKSDFQVILKSLKHNAMADALKQSGADIIVEPVFETKRSEGFSHETFTTTVVGFPGTYTKFRPLTEKESEMLEKLGKTGLEKK